MQRSTAKKICLAACVAACAAATAMPSRSELKKVQSLVNELMADDIQAMKAGKLKPVQVAANAEKLAGDAEGEAAKFLLYKGAFGLYVQGGSYDEAISAIDHLKAAVKDVPDKVVAEILREKLKRIPKKNGSAIFNLYDGICRRMAAMDERGKLEKQLKASPADRQTRRLLAVRCAQMGDWKAAREHFLELRGKEAAAVKAEDGDIAEAADFWWGYQPDIDGVDGDPFREYAASLYRRAIDAGKLPGLKLMLAKKRIAEVGGGAGETQQKGEPAAAEPPAKVKVAEKPRVAEPQPAVRGGGRQGDWALPKNFKGPRCLDFDIGGGEILPFVAISAGSARYFNERQRLPQHEICITRPFWITRIPVTSRQFRLAGIDIDRMGGDFFEEKFADDKDAIILACPLIEYAEQYAKWMNEKFGSSLPKGWVFRLPTQGELLQLSAFSLRAGYKSWNEIHGSRLDNQWMNAVHAKGMFADYKTIREIKSPCIMFFAQALIVGASDLQKEKNLVFSNLSRSHCLDRISLSAEGVDRRSVLQGIGKDPKMALHLAKALNYRPKETDPFRYVDDGTPEMVFASGHPWSPPFINVFHIVVGPDYVGEWKAKNGK